MEDVIGLSTGKYMESESINTISKDINLNKSENLSSGFRNNAIDIKNGWFVQSIRDTEDSALTFCTANSFGRQR